MKTTLHYIISILILIYVSTTACTKKETEKRFLESFDSLCVSSNIVIIGETLKVTAYAQGANLLYTWNVSSGDMVGGGNQIEYIPHPCTHGEQTITCNIQADNTTESKSVTIYVQ